MAFTSNIKTVGIELVPFINTFTLYFALLIPTEKPSLFAACIKCLPVLSLILFICLQGYNSDEDLAFKRKIRIGLLFSCLGDALLVWPDYFIFGMLAFGIAHLFYISAFGCKPLVIIPGIILYILAAIMVYVLFPGLNEAALKIGVPIYSFLLATMAWRAIARIFYYSCAMTWINLMIGLGGILWVLSDGLLGYHHFLSPIPYSQILIMVTYYLGQLGIALSVLDPVIGLPATKTCAPAKPKTN